MKLRARLALGVILVALPVSVLAFGIERHRERERIADITRERTLARLEGLDAASCEAFPESFPDVREDPGDWLFGEAILPIRPMSPVAYFVLDSEGRAFRDDAPRLPPRVVDAIGERRDVSFRGVRGAVPVARDLVFPPWRSEVCAAILVEHPLPPRPLVRGQLLPAAVVLGSVVLAVLVVAGPVVARIRRLTVAAERGEVRAIDVASADELGDLARAFAARERTIESQIADIEARERAMREHLAATSHDVLLPVTVLQGHLVAIDEAVASGTTPDAATVRGALEETHYVASLVRDLNADARLRTGMVVESEVDLAALVERAHARHAPIARRAGVELAFARPDSKVVVRGDETLLEQMISNVVHNAVRYVERGGHVAVILDAKDGRFELVVRDDGPGVPDSALERLGDRGFRTDDARTRRPEGTGLGLHIVREVAGKHGYSVRFERGEPSGLVVRIEGTYASGPTKADGGDAVRDT